MRVLGDLERLRRRYGCVIAANIARIEIDQAIGSGICNLVRFCEMFGRLGLKSQRPGSKGWSAGSCVSLVLQTEP